ncbi:MAG: hypothetical protein HFH32_15175 [Eubacterium sp.]|nr:hypothetical protein [Eubacterium sp.]
MQTAGTRNLYCSSEPARKLEDLARMHTRVQESELLAELLKHMGAFPVQIS